MLLVLPEIVFALDDFIVYLFKCLFFIHFFKGNMPAFLDASLLSLDFNQLYSLLVVLVPSRYLLDLLNELEVADVELKVQTGQLFVLLRVWDQQVHCLVSQAVMSQVNARQRLIAQ